MPSRRRFISVISCSGVAAWFAVPAQAAPATLDPKDPLAVSLGYVSDATQADKTKYPTYAPGQACGVCQLYQGKPGDESGPCPLYAGKTVSVKGWCSAFAKKA